MDHLRFIFSLLLIVSITTTTFGSAIKAKNPNGEQLDALLERSKHSNPRMNSGDQDSEKQKRTGAGPVIGAAMLGISALKGVLAAVGGVDRKITIDIGNESGYKWERPSHYFHSGTSDQTLPSHLDNGKALLYSARKSKGLLPGGVVGVVAFYVPGISKTVAVLFSVPYDYNLYQNWWNVKLYNGDGRANYAMYEDLYYGANPFRANGQHKRDLGNSLKFRGEMTSAGQATLKIQVLKK